MTVRSLLLHRRKKKHRNHASDAPPSTTRNPFCYWQLAVMIFGGWFVYTFFSQPLSEQDTIVKETQNRADKLERGLQLVQDETERLPETQEELKSRVQKLEQVIADANEQLNLLRHEASERQLDNARHRAWVARMHDEGERMREALQSLASKLADWEVTLSSLMNNEEGKRIAASPSVFEAFAQIEGGDRPDQEQIKEWKKQLEILLAEIDNSYSNPEESLTINEELENDIRQLAEEIRAARDSVSQQHAALRAIRREVKDQQIADDDPSLAEALQAYRDRRAKEKEQRIAEEAERVRQEYLDKLAEERAETERIFGEAALEKERMAQAGAKLLAEIEKKKIAEATEDARREEAIRVAEREAKLAREELERRFEQEWPSMQAYLIPFTTDGYTQPGGYGFKRTAKKGPVSFGKLKGMGMLKKSLEGLNTLYYATTANGMNDRDNGGFPEYVGGTQDWNQKQDTIQRIQDFLNEFGPLMVDKGLLAP